jgi:hypothetical protein
MFAFGAGTLVAIQTQDATGAAIANPTPVRLGTMQEVQGDISFDTKKLYGAYQFPVALGRGKASLNFKAKTGTIDGNVLNRLLFGLTPSAGLHGMVIDAINAIPGTPFQVTIAPPLTGVFFADMGVSYAATGAQLTRVASAPNTGQYSVNVATGIYTFAAADTALSVLISYEYTSSSATGSMTTLTNQLMGQSPFFAVMLQESYGGKNFALKLNQCTSSKLSLPFKNEDFTISDFDFEAFADGSNNVGFCSLF